MSTKFILPSPTSLTAEAVRSLAQVTLLENATPEGLFYSGLLEWSKDIKSLNLDYKVIVQFDSIKTDTFGYIQLPSVKVINRAVIKGDSYEK